MNDKFSQSQVRQMAQECQARADRFAAHAADFVDMGWDEMARDAQRAEQVQLMLTAHYQARSGDAPARIERPPGTSGRVVKPGEPLLIK